VISEELKEVWVSVGGKMLLGFASVLFMCNFSVNRKCQGTKQSGYETICGRLAG